MSHGTGEPPVDPPPDQTPARPEWRIEDVAAAIDGADPKPQYESGMDGCLAAVGKGILILVIGVFVFAGLIFATCFLSMQR